jgi:uncharacterized RDD family membrane protein YckC
MEDQEKYKTGLRRLGAMMADAVLFLPLMYVDALVSTEKNPVYYIPWIILFTLINLAYSILMHGAYGQTLGKKLLRLKVMDLSEERTINYRQAFHRESIFIIIEIITFGFLLSYLLQNPDDPITIITTYEDFVAVTTFSWIFLDFVSMLLHPQSRAIHDQMANSVVVKY